MSVPTATLFPPPVQETYAYNKRLQPAMIELGTSGNPAADSCRVYNYYAGTSNPTSCAMPTPSTDNNGNVAAYYYVDNVNPGLNHTATYLYDSVNRLYNAYATGNVAYNQAYTYTGDGSNGQYGNVSCTPAGPGCVNFTYSATTNHITTGGYAYDLAGDVTGDGTYTYSGDAEGRLGVVYNGKGAANATNTYNALGQRVRDVASVYGTTTDEPYGADGSLLWRYTGNTSSNRSFTPFNGSILAEYWSGGALFDHHDQLGSLTTSTDYTGNNFNERLFYPYGEAWTGAGLPNFGMQQSFAQLPDYDMETDQYNTLHRHYTPMGRWMSPDSVRGDPSNPQSLNLFSYVLNLPTTNTDPSGLCGCGWGCGGGGGGGRLPSPGPIIPIPGIPSISTPGGGFPNPLTLETPQQPSPWFNVLIILPLPPFPPLPPEPGEEGGGGGCGGGASSFARAGGGGGCGGGNGGAGGTCTGSTSNKPKSMLGDLCKYIGTGKHPTFVEEWSCKGNTPCCAGKIDAYVSSCYDRKGGNYVASEVFWWWDTPFVDCCKW